jgi:hypothetical protein
MTLMQDLGLAEIIVADFEAVASGQPVSTTKSIGGGKSLAVSAVKLTAPTPPEYTVFTGSFWQVLGLVVAAGAEFAAGAPLKIAAKEGNSWWGISLSLVSP